MELAILVGLCCGGLVLWETLLQHHGSIAFSVADTRKEVTHQTIFSYIQLANYVQTENPGCYLVESSALLHLFFSLTTP